MHRVSNFAQAAFLQTLGFHFVSVEKDDRGRFVYLFPRTDDILLATAKWNEAIASVRRRGLEEAGERA